MNVGALNVTVACSPFADTHDAVTADVPGYAPYPSFNGNNEQDAVPSTILNRSCMVMPLPDTCTDTVLCPSFKYMFGMYTPP